MKKLITSLSITLLLISCSTPDKQYTAKSVQTENVMSSDWQIPITKIRYITYKGVTTDTLQDVTEDAYNPSVIKWNAEKQTLILYTSDTIGHNLSFYGKVMDGKLVDMDSNPGCVSVYDFSQIKDNKIIQTYSITDTKNKAGVKNNSEAIFY